MSVVADNWSAALLFRLLRGASVKVSALLRTVNPCFLVVNGLRWIKSLVELQVVAVGNFRSVFEDKSLPLTSTNGQ